MMLRLLLLAALFVAPNVLAIESRVILDVPAARDHFFDLSRNALYLTTDFGEIVRYDLATGEFLSPIQVGSRLRGMDISLDSKYLYVADDTLRFTQNVFHRVDLEDLSTETFTYPNARSEAGSLDVKIAANGIGLLTSDFEGTGRVPLRQIDTITQAISPRSDIIRSSTQISGDSYLQRSADRSTIVLIQGNNSDGPVALYKSHSDSFTSQAVMGYSLGQGGVAINGDGSRIAFSPDSAFDPILILDSNLNLIQTIDVADFHRVPGMDFGSDPQVLYYVDAQDDEIVQYDLQRQREISRFAIGSDIINFPPNDFSQGQLSVSPDGKWMALSLAGQGFDPGAVALFRIPVPEPSTDFLILIGLASTLFWRARVQPAN